MRAVGVALFVLSGIRTASAAPCPPTAELAGERVAIERVAAELRRLGVVVRAAPAAVAEDVAAFAGADRCRVIHVFVEREDDGAIAAVVRGGARASERRVLSDPALAAAWVDTWTRADVDGALWAPPLPGLAVTTSSSRPSPAAHLEIVAPRDVAPAPGPPSMLERAALAASYEQAWSDDDARWRGVGIAGCVRVDGFCAGARIRALVDPARIVGVTAMERSDLSALGTLSYPLAVGTMSLAPELGIGIGRLATTRVEGTCTPMQPPPCDPMDPACTMPPPSCESQPGTPIEVGDGLAERTYAVRFELALRVAVPLFRHVWLEGLAGLGWSPFAHTAPFAGTPGPTTMVSGDQLALPGEPRTSYQLGVGVRVGAP